MSALIFGLFGLIIGSFLNVVVLRHGAKSLGGRSACMSCGKPIAWYDNIPVVSWLYLRGRCRMCGSAISVQYPLVEISTALLFAFLAAGELSHVPLAFDLPGLVHLYATLALYCFVGALLISISVYDIRHTIIPDRWVYLFALFALASSFFGISPGYNSVLLLLAAGPIGALPLFALWAVSGGRWMGFGDVKLALGIGWLLGPVSGLFAVFFAFILGACVSVPLLGLSSPYLHALVRRFTPTLASSKGLLGFTMGSEIPFGPFLVCSCIIVWLFLINGIELWRIFVPLPL